MTQAATHPRWKTKQLAEVATIDRRIVDPTTLPTGTRYIGLEHIDGEGQFVGEHFVGPDDLASAKFSFGPQHVLYGKLRPYLKKTALPSFQGVCSTDILPIRPTPSLSREYLYYFLRLPSVVQFVTGRSSGANLPRISPTHLANLPIPLPNADDPPRSLLEQRRIACILGKADAIRRQSQVALANCATLASAIFLEMFGDPGHNRRRWPTCRLGDVAQLDRGKSRHRPRDEPSLYGGPYPFVQTGDVTNADGYIVSYTQTYSELGLAQSRLWPKGTLCITIAANIAKTAVLTFDACFPDSVVGLLPGPRFTVEYIREWFVLSEKRIDAAATQVAQKNINLAILNDLEVVLPPLDDQREFSRRVLAIQAVRNRMVMANDDANALFSSLEQRAFRGDI